MSTELIDYLVLKFISLQKDNIYFACFWPVADNQSKLNEAIKLISNIVYKKEIILSKEGLQNYMLQLFDTQSWVGTIENHFEELNGKVNECYKPCSQLKIVIFKEKGLKEVNVVNLTA